MDDGFGAALRRRRISAQLTQEELAARSGLSARSLGDIERGRVRQPRADTVRLIATALGLSDAELAEFQTLARAGYWAGRTAADPRPHLTRSGGPAGSTAARPPGSSPRQQAASASDQHAGQAAGTAGGEQREAAGTAGEAGGELLAAPVPAQLPADVAAFTGRAGSLQQLDAVLSGAAAGVTICAVTGSAGVGKTALAVHWAHRVRHRFPDGQLYLNLRGYDTGPPLRPIDALSRLLHGLGVAAEQVPTEVSEAAALFRSRLADKQVLLVLDNARHSAQVRPLLPGGGDSLVIITSRDTMTGLVARNGAHRLSLDVLDPAEALVLLRRVLGPDRVAAEPAAAAELARLCDHLPLALRISAANLVGRPYECIGGLVEKLGRGDRLDALAVDGDDQAGVRAAFDLSYAALPEPVRRTFRLVGLVPGPDLTATAAAALTGDTPAGARRSLDTLAAAHLVDPLAPDRYALHDLLRLYARQRSREEDGGGSTEAAADRLLHWYLHAARAAAEHLYPQILRLPADPAVPAELPEPGFTDAAGALSWLDAERVNLLAAIQHAAAHRPVRISWLLTDVLRGYFWQTRHTVDWLESARAGLCAANCSGDERAAAAMELSSAMANHCLQRYGEAIEHYAAAAARARAAGWVDAEGAASGNLGLVHAELGNLAEAVECQQEVLTLARRTGRNEGRAAALNNLGWAYGQLGQLRHARTCLTEALSYHLHPGDGTRAHTLDNLGSVERFLGNLDTAQQYLDQALAAYQQVGNRYGVAEVTLDQALLHSDAGRPEQAAAAAAAAMAVAVESRDRHGQANIHSLLGQLTADPAAAIEEFQRALRLCGETGARFTEAEARMGLAVAYRRLTQYRRSLAQAETALELARQAGYRVLEGQALTTLGETRLAGGDYRRAGEDARAALAAHTETGYRLGTARAHRLLGTALYEAGDPAARRHWSTALSVYTELGVPEAAEVADLLESYVQVS